MRTTIEFDPDVSAELTRRRKRGVGTLREDVNGLIRLGLARERDDVRTSSGHRRFRTPTFDSGPPLFPVDDVAAALAHAEGEDHR